MQPFEQAWTLLKAGPYARRGSMTGVPEKLTQNRYRTLDAEGNLGFMGPQHDDMETYDLMPLLSQRGMSEGKLIDTKLGEMHHFKDGQVLSGMNTQEVNDPNSNYAQQTPSFENQGKGAQFDYYGPPRGGRADQKPLELPMPFADFTNYMTE